MLNDEICKLRNKLNQSIEQKKDYNITYKISVELDELIAKYYEDKQQVCRVCKAKRSNKRNKIELDGKT